jgi:hypothetical protein
MKIRMIKQTFWEGAPLRVGDTPDVEEHVAIRWLAKGIAEEIIPPSENSGDDGSEETGKTEGDKGKEPDEKKTPPPPVKKSTVNAGKKLGEVIKKQTARATGGD